MINYVETIELLNINFQFVLLDDTMLYHKRALYMLAAGQLIPVFL